MLSRPNGWTTSNSSSPSRKLSPPSPAMMSRNMTSSKLSPNEDPDPGQLLNEWLGELDNLQKVKKNPNLEIYDLGSVGSLFSLSSCFVYFMQPCPRASAGFSPIGCQPPKWPPSGHSESKYSENFFCVYRTAFWFVSLDVSRIS
jgi:hypothetical protein